MTIFASSSRLRRMIPLACLSVLGSASILLVSSRHAQAVTTPKGTAPVPVTIPDPLTLDQAVSIALSHLPAVDSAHTQIDQANGIKEEETLLRYDRSRTVVVPDRLNFFPSLKPAASNEDMRSRGT